jgi:hypothetical protein
LLFSLLDYCVALPCMAFLLFLPLSNHHSNVNVLFSTKLLGILYTTTTFVSHMWLYQIYVWINIIISNEYWWENNIIQKNQKNPLFGVMLIIYLIWKRMNVWKHILNQFKSAKFGLTFFSNFDSKDHKNILLHNDQTISSYVLIFITHSSPILGVKKRGWRIIQMPK